MPCCTTLNDACSPVPCRKTLELERKLVAVQRQVENKNPESIRTREEISHLEKRKAMSIKSLEKVAARCKQAN